MKPPLLYLCHRIPYPPNKGDKIRSFHLLKHLAKSFRIYLGAFIDDPADWEQVEKLDAWCEVCYFRELDPKWGRIRSLKGLLNRQPLTLPYYHDPGMAQWVEQTTRKEKIAHILIYSSAMAQYIDDPVYDKIRRVVDFVDVDSDKWRQYAEKKSWPLNWVYRREAMRLLGFERMIANRFDASLFVSNEEAKLFQGMAPESAGKISFYSNGVDLEFFSPERDYPDPYPDGGPSIVFVGAMDYWPNEDAVSWFAKEVLPSVRVKWPDALFYIVGSRPSDRVKGLGKIKGVKVTASVPDVRPYIHHATAVVAPMHIARGIQNKVLEAMSMAKPVVVTGMGLEGIDADNGSEVLVADNAPEFVASLDSIFSGTRSDMGSMAREKIQRDFSWDSTLPKIDQWMK